MLYLWIKAFHVYHSEVPKGSIQSETFKIMERRLLKAIINPAMGLAWILGLILIWQGGWYTSGWLHAKVLLVLILSGVHGFLSKTVKVFAADANVRPAKFYRMINEVPTVLMIGIVILVIVKPF
jgi:putative membrane protein